MKRETIELLALVATLALAVIVGGCTRYGIKACSALPHTHQGAELEPSVYGDPEFVACDTDMDCQIKNGGSY